MHVASKDGKEVSETDVRVSDIALLQPHPRHAYIGGLSDTEPVTMLLCILSISLKLKMVIIFYNTSAMWRMFITNDTYLGIFH